MIKRQEPRLRLLSFMAVGDSYAAAREAFFRSCSCTKRLRMRMDFGVISTSGNLGSSEIRGCRGCSSWAYAEVLSQRCFYHLSERVPMKLLKLLIIVSVVLSSAALAQSANPYNGKWTVKFDGTTMANATGTVVIKDDQGTWKIVAHSTKNPCIGFEAPITVQRASDDELVFEVVRSKVLSGCGDSTLSLKRVDEKTLQGEFSDGRKVMLFRD